MYKYSENTHHFFLSHLKDSDLQHITCNSEEKQGQKTISQKNEKQRHISETNLTLKLELWVLVVRDSEGKGTESPHIISYSLPCKMTGLGGPGVLNLGSSWKCVDSFVVGG